MKSKVWMGSLRPAPNQRLQPTRFAPSLRPALASPQPAVAGLGAADYIRLPACGSLMLASAYQADGAVARIGATCLCFARLIRRAVGRLTITVVISPIIHKLQKDCFEWQQ
jgi:hypothetical protein